MKPPRRIPQPMELVFFRELYGLTQVEAAQLCGITERMWQYYEGGQFRMKPHLWRYVRMAASVDRRRAAKPTAAQQPSRSTPA